MGMRGTEMGPYRDSAMGEMGPQWQRWSCGRQGWDWSRDDMMMAVRDGAVGSCGALGSETGPRVSDGAGDQEFAMM